MLIKVQVRTKETVERRLIVEAILSYYPYKGVMQKDYNGDETRYTFLTKATNLDLLRHDLENLKLCKFNAEMMRVD